MTSFYTHSIYCFYNYTFFRFNVKNNLITTTTPDAATEEKQINGDQHLLYHQERRRQSISMFSTDWERRWKLREIEYSKTTLRSQQEHNVKMLKLITTTDNKKQKKTKNSLQNSLVSI